MLSDTKWSGRIGVPRGAYHPLSLSPEIEGTMALLNAAPGKHYLRRKSHDRWEILPPSPMHNDPPIMDMVGGGEYLEILEKIGLVDPVKQQSK